MITRASTALALALVLTLGGCGALGLNDRQANVAANEARAAAQPRRATLWDLFSKNTDANVTVRVNKYIWNASLDVLDFLPVESIDPFTGVIVTGYGKPPGGGRSYRATIYVQDPALDARSLKLSLQGPGGAAVSPETVSAVEDAILNRARELRIADSKL